MTQKQKRMVFVVVCVLAAVGIAVNTVVLRQKMRIKGLFREAKDAHIRQDLVTATERYRELLALSPEDENSRVMLGVVLMDRGLQDEAEKELNEVLKINSKNARAYGFLASLYFQQENFDKATSFALEALKLEPKSDSTLLLGAIAYLRKDYDGAENYLKKLLVMYPEKIDGYLYLARTYKAQGKIDEAVANFEKAVSLNPLKDQFIFEAAKLYEDRGEYEKAAEVYRRAMKRIQNQSLRDALARAESKIKAK
jgi:tetratricopeptide (TPR) repeat protein